MKLLLPALLILALAACNKPFTTYEKPKVQYGQCPIPFWIPDYVAAEFRKFPAGHPMNEFFRAYVRQQTQLEAYHDAKRFGAKPPMSHPKR